MDKYIVLVHRRIIWVPSGGPCGGIFIVFEGYIPIGGICPCDWKVLDDVEYIPTNGGIGWACG